MTIVKRPCTCGNGGYCACPMTAYDITVRDETGVYPGIEAWQRAHAAAIPPTHTAPVDLAKLSTTKPEPWQCPGCGCWQAPFTPKCDCVKEGK